MIMDIIFALPIGPLVETAAFTSPSTFAFTDMVPPIGMADAVIEHGANRHGNARVGASSRQGK